MELVKPWIARLSDYDLDSIEADAFARYSYNRRNHFAQRDNCEPGSIMPDLVGRLGEVVGAWLLGVPPCPAVGVVGEDDLPNGVQTRARQYKPPLIDLVLLPKDRKKAERPFVLLHVSCGLRLGRYVKAVGWILGRDGMRDQFRADTVRFDGPAWFVMPRCLHAMEELRC